MKVHKVNTGQIPMTESLVENQREPHQKNKRVIEWQLRIS